MTSIRHIRTTSSANYLLFFSISSDSRRRRISHASRRRCWKKAPRSIAKPSERPKSFVRCGNAIRSRTVPVPVPVRRPRHGGRWPGPSRRRQRVCWVTATLPSTNRVTTWVELIITITIIRPSKARKGFRHMHSPFRPRRSLGGRNFGIISICVPRRGRRRHHLCFPERAQSPSATTRRWIRRW